MNKKIIPNIWSTNEKHAKPCLELGLFSFIANKTALTELTEGVWFSSETIYETAQSKAAESFWTSAALETLRSTTQTWQATVSDYSMELHFTHIWCFNLNYEYKLCMVVVLD